MNFIDLDRHHVALYLETCIVFFVIFRKNYFEVLPSVLSKLHAVFWNHLCCANGKKLEKMTPTKPNTQDHKNTAYRKKR